MILSCNCLLKFNDVILKNSRRLITVRMLTSKGGSSNKRSNKQSKDEFVRVLPKESDYSMDEKDHYWLTFSKNIQTFLEEFKKTGEETNEDQLYSTKNNIIETVPGFSYNDQASIDDIRKKSADKVTKRIKQVENEVIEEDRLAEQKEIDDLIVEMKYLQSISDKFITYKNLETTINRVLHNPTCYCYALDINGNKHHGYTQIEGQEMKSLWDGNPHPSSFESYVDTRKPLK